MLNKFYTTLITTSLLIIALPCLSDGIDQNCNVPDMIQESLLSSDQLANIANRCRQEISQAHKLQSQVPLPNKREYAITLGIASNKCEDLIKAFHTVQQAQQDYAEYKKNIQHAKSSATANNNSDYTYRTPINTDIGFAPELYDTHTTEPNDFVLPSDNQIIEEDLSSNAEPIALY